VHAYNHARPHQALAMATPARLFRPAPPDLTGRPAQQPADSPDEAPEACPAPAPDRAVIVPVSAGAVEFDTVIAGTGLLSVLPRVQRVKMGAERAGQLAHIWADEHSVHILIDGTLVKTMASNLAPADLNELRLRGARPAGPPPAAAAVRAGKIPAEAAIEADRTVGDSGTLSLGGTQVPLGMQFARQRVTVRLDGHLLQVIRGGVLAKTLPSPIAAGQRTKIRGARLATGALPVPPAGPVSVERRVPAEGVIMVTRQRIRVGRAHAGKTVTVILEDTHLRMLHNGEELSLHPRTSTGPVSRYRAYAPRKSK
jgi:hypothetical protein